MNPMLHLLSDGQPRRITDIAADLAEYFHLTEDELAELIPSGRKSRHYDRVGWAATYMKQACLLSSPQRGLYQITERGLEVVRSGDVVNTKYLQRFREFEEFRNRSGGTKTVNGPPAPPPDTPEEILEVNYQQLRGALAAELLDRLKQTSPRFFEQAVIDLLLAMGYGGSQREAAQRIGKTGDGGIDGIISEDRLGLDVIYIQAKRWKEGPVGARDVRDFAGSLEEKRASKGVFITTSDFTRDAREYVDRIGKRIVLIDGEQLAEMMIDFNIGITARRTYVVKRIDEDYFSEEGF
ncbi:MAG: restriction endonuclease [Aggregatilineales bacterium]